MYLKEQTSNHLIEVLSVQELFDPYKTALHGRSHYGEELQEPERFTKRDLVFLSGEELPRCWLDPHYRDGELRRKRRGVH